MKALSITISTIWPMLKFLKSKSRSAGQILVPIEKSCHKEYTYEISKPYHLRFGQC
jgi:hypothetical protein